MIRYFLMPFILLSITISCSKEKASMLMPQYCASATPTLVGKWVLSEFRYYGGCCPVIADSAWKKAPTEPEQRTILEFTADGKVQYVLPSGVGSMNQSISTAFATPTVQTTVYRLDGNELIIEEQILGGVPWYKDIPIKKLTNTELTLQILVGKEGEKNDRLYKRICE